MLAGNERILLFQEIESLDLRNIPSPTWMETPTPHRMAVTILVQVYIEKNSAKQSILQYSQPKHRKNLCMLLLKLMQYPDMSYSDLYLLITLSTYKIDPIHFERFEKAIARLTLKNVEHAFDLAEIQSIETILAEDAALSQFSLVGLYMRRVGAVLQRMTFPEILNLHEKFCKYYEKGMRNLAIGPTKIRAFMYNESDEDCLASAALNKNDNSKSHNSSTRFLDTVSHIDYDDCDISPAKFTPKVPKLTKQDVFNNVTASTSKAAAAALAAATAAEAEAKTANAIQQDQHVEYFKNQEKWSEKQAELFVQQQCQLLETNPLRALSPLDLHKKVSEIIDCNPLFPHAYYLSYMNQIRICDYIGSLASMHRAFDRSPNNMMRLQDQNGFQYFSLSLSKLQAQFGHRNEALAALKECVMLAQESGDKRCLDLATTLYATLNHKDIDPTEKILTNLQDPLLVDSLSLAILNVVKFGAERGVAPLESFEILAKSEEINSKHYLIERMADVLALRSALWCIYGRSDFTILYAQMLLDLDKRSIFADASNVDSVSMALSSLLRWFYLNGMPNLGKVLMQHSRLRFNHPPLCNTWMISNLISTAEYAIYSCAWNAAERLISQLHTFNRPHSLLLSITMAISRRSWPMVDKVLMELHYEAKTLTVMQRVRMLILEGFSKQMTLQGLMPLFHAASIAATNHMVYEEAFAKICMAQLLLCTGMLQKAHQVCMSAIGQILQSGGLYERSLALFVFLRCRLAISKTREHKIKLLKRACSTANSIIEDFRSLKAHGKVFDVLTFMADNFNELGYTAMRNRYANQYCQYYRDYPQGVGHMHVPV